MGLADYLILAVILLLAFFAIRYLWRRKGSGCAGCSGCCQSCAHGTPDCNPKNTGTEK